MNELINPCLSGHGISCGLTVRFNDNSSLSVGAGTAIIPDGRVVHLPEKLFWNYLKRPQPAVAAYFGNTKVWELTDQEDLEEPDNIDSFVPQYRTDDQPGAVFLDDKILVVYVDEKAACPPAFVLVRQVDMVRLTKREADVRRLAEPVRGNPKPGIFANPRTTLSFDSEHIEAALFPYRQLPHVSLPRFGYKTLAVIDKNKKWNFDDPTSAPKVGTTSPPKLDNLRNPFLRIANPPLPKKTGESVSVFSLIFDEYKAILDEAFPAFKLALRVLHAQFGSLLTDNAPAPQKPKTARPKETTCMEPVQDEFAKYREVLCRKWQCFKEEGEHLYYIQYFYDWLADLITAYEAFRLALIDFSAECLCDEQPDSKNPPNLLLLGPVITEEFNYKPLIFRDYFVEPFTYNHNEERLRELKCLHQRLMLMIWTFDLPALQLERKVLQKGGYTDTAEEFKDSTNFWEQLITRRDSAGKIDPDKSGKPVFDLNQLPVRITPSRALTEPLGQQAIPYYYPIDANSVYSVHRVWDFVATKTNRTDRHLSYNAHSGDDSYTDHPDILFPLAFNIRPYPFLRVEGHIGRTTERNYTVKDATGNEVSFTSTVVEELEEIIGKYNLGLEVMSVDISKLIPPINQPTVPSELENFLDRLNKLRGLEHQNGGYAGQTLLLFYVSAAEQIELNECKKDKTAEIPAGTIVADFTLPYLYSMINP